MSQPGLPQRELVYCHECENEWYRDENGIICPDCQSDFTECIEPDHDPRIEHEGDMAPDPDEDDIGQFEWTNNAPGQPPGGHLHRSIHRTITLGPGQNQDGAAGGGILGLFAPAIEGVLRNAFSNPHQGPLGTERAGLNSTDGERTGNESPRPDQQQQQQREGGRTFSGSGPGFAYTITSSTNLHPRDADTPQPIRVQTTDLGTMMQAMINNMGVAPAPGAAGHPSVAMGMRGQPIGIGDLLAMFGGPGFNGMHGDAVYSEQDLDRIMTQLAEQHAAEHAPPRASDEAIEALPRRKISEEDFSDAGQAECSICIGKVELADEVTVLPCKHWFHHDCVKPWLESHDTCPHCRKGIMPKDDTGGNLPRNPDQAPHHDINSRGAPQPPMLGIFNRMREAFAPGNSNVATSDTNTSGDDTTSTRPDNEG